MFDVIVIGVGGMGSATVYQVARRGASVIGLEQFYIPHDLGSSHGVNRIIRLAYAEDPRYVPLLRRAYALWRELEQRAGDQLLFITGGIDAGREASATVTGSLRSCAEHDLPHEVLDAGALHHRFPGCRFPPELMSVYQADAGFVMSERAIVAHVESAVRLGATVHRRERVVQWTAETDGVHVRTDRAEYRGRKLVITAGPWAATVAPILQGLTIPERQVLIWTEPLRPERFRLGAFPIFNMETDEGRFYGFPVHGVPGFKLGKYHHRRQRVDPDAMDRECHLEDEQVLREGIRRYFPDADGPTLAMKTCMFTNTADEHFVLDVLPDARHVSVAAGFSGHGYKFCSVVGEIMADLALDGDTTWDLELFRLERLLA